MVEETDLSHISLRDRPLVVCDIDEVVFEFILPLTNFLRANGHDLLPRSFRLHGNIVSLKDGSEADADRIAAFQEKFFSTQDQWQMPARLAVETLKSLAAEMDIVFLTAMPPRHRILRRALLDRFDLPYPMISTEQPKGPIVERLHSGRSLPLAFIDDIPRNLQSVKESVPDCLLIHLMASTDFRALMPPVPTGIRSAADWDMAGDILRQHASGFIHS